MGKIKFFIFIFGLIIAINTSSQNVAFNILLEPINIKELIGIQSFAYGQHEGKWLIIGGRIDGLHRKQPFASFDIEGHNTQLYVIDPVTQQKWTAPIVSLSTELQEQLKSTNMEFYQRGRYLYLLGGYGFSSIADDHTTFNKLIAIDVPSTINAIISNSGFESYFRQITDDQFQVTGGRLEKINNTFYLVGGQKFIGRYNPMGPDHGPGFEQVYTNQIRKFNIVDNGKDIIINHLPCITDVINLHRRDYNLAAQIMPDGQEGLTVFSGVFQTDYDLPYLNCVNIDSNGYNVNNEFSQYYNHYHCAHLNIYSANQNEMNTLFFGGIAQYFDESGMLVQNNNVPFVKTIARVNRDAKGKMSEYKLAVEMPDLLGAGSEFIQVENLPHYQNGVIKIDDLKADTTIVGYIYGGISSSDANIFWINDGSQSSASSHIYKVLLTKDSTSSKHHLNNQSIGNLKMMVYPITNDGYLIVKYNLYKPTNVKLSIYTEKGKKIEERIFENRLTGENVYKKKLIVTENEILIISIETQYDKAIQKIIIEP